MTKEEYYKIFKIFDENNINIANGIDEQTKVLFDEYQLSTKQIIGIYNAKKAIEIMDADYQSSEFYEYCQVFSMSNEPLESIIPTFPQKFKIAFLVAASGDALIDYLASEADFSETEHIVLFDINYLTKYWVYFKLAAILNFDYEEYIEIISNITKFEVKIPDTVKSEFNKVIPFCDEEVTMFWNTLYDLGYLNTFKLLNFFVLVKKNQTLTRESYNRLKNNLSLVYNKIIFEQGDLRDINSIVKKVNNDLGTNLEIRNSDFAYTSNVIDRIPESASELAGILSWMKEISVVCVKFPYFSNKFSHLCKMLGIPFDAIVNPFCPGMIMYSTQATPSLKNNL